MPIVKNAATSLSQGVSQQAESQRYPSQADEQINAYSSHIKGLVKRPPTKHIGNLDLNTSSDSFIHTINRDSSEQYSVVVSPYTTVVVNSIDTSPSTLNVSTQLALNDAVRFSLTTPEGTLPTGLSTKITYYVLSISASGPNWNITISKTKGGAIVRLGKAEIDEIRFTSVKDGGTGQWVDGVSAVTFAANHGLVAGDLIKLEGLTGKALTFLGETTEYELRVPDNYNYHFTYANSTYSTATWPADKFLLGVPNANKNSLADNLGYYVDKQWQTDGDESGYTMMGDGASPSNLHFVLLDGEGAITHTKGNKLKWDHSDAGGDEATWPSGWDATKLIGSVIRLGSRRGKSKAYRAIVADADISARTLTLDHYVDLNNELFDVDLYDSSGDPKSYNTTSNPKWVFVAYWADTTTYTYSAGSNPRQFTEAEADAAYVGVDAGVGEFRIEKGGIKIFDVNTGSEKQLNVESGLDYITEGNSPRNNLTAVTVADYTFLVNKIVTTQSHSKTKYDKKYEAIITARTADYGKRYKVKVGEAASPLEVKDTGTASTVAYVDLVGRDRNLKEDKWIARIQSISSDPKWNGWQFRVVQNWNWDSNYVLPNANPDQDFKHTDKLPPQPTSIPATVKTYYYKNERIAVYVGDGWITIYGNFHWSNSDTVKGNLTTVQDLIDVFSDTPDLAKDWEVKTLTGGASSSTAVVAGNNTNAQYYTLQNVIVGSAGETVSTELPYKATYVYGRDESINTGWVPFYGNTAGSAYITAGYLTPSAKVTNIERKYFTSKAGRIQAGADWDTTTGTTAVQVVETGEYWYKSPKWTGDDFQQAIGTERIAEMLASNAKINRGRWINTDPRKANGRKITTRPAGWDSAITSTDNVAHKGEEEALGLTYSGPSSDKGYLYDVNAAGTNKRLGEHTSDWRVQQQGYTIALMAPDREQFQITVEDDLGGMGLKLTYFEVGEAADLPDVCRQGHIVKVVGSAREEADDYYLRFEADDPNETSVLQHGRWVECVGYNQQYKFEEATMPVGLVRETDGSFSLKQLTWSERKAGDDNTNPFPSFRGNTINDVFLFRNRLGFLSGENVILSEAGEYFNFFRTTTAALLDSAPIDATASTNKVSTLRSALPHNEKLLIFSEQTQFILDGEPYLSPKTVSITPTTEFTSFPNVKPVVSGKAVYYGFSRTDFSGVGEFSVSVQDSDMADAVDVTAHCPKYIKGDITMFAASPTEDVVCCITDDSTSGATMYVYKFFTNTQNQKVQSAWFKYVFGGTGDTIEAIDFINTKLYMVITRNNQTYLESLTFEDSQKDTGLDYEVLLDRKLPKSSLTNVTSTTVTLPYNVTANTKLITADSVYKGSSTTGSTTFTVSGVDLTATDFYVGELYEMLYTFSQPFLKSEKATETGRYQIQRAFLEYANARTFDVDVVHNPTMSTPNKVTVTNTFATSSIQQGLIEGSADLQQGFYKIGIQEKNDRLQLTLKNNVPYPSDFLSIDYEARAYSRGSRWRG